MPPKDLTHVLRVTLDRAHNVVAATVCTYENEDVTYRVEILPGPFDTLGEVCNAALAAVDRQEALF